MLPRVLLVAAILISPWLYGSVHEWAQIWLFWLIVPALLYTFMLQLVRRGRRKRVSLGMILLLMALGWGAIQMVPLPQRFAAFASPEATQLRGQLLPNQSSADADLADKLDVAASGGQAISLRPGSTRYVLALLALGVATFFLASQWFDSPRSQFWLYTLVAANGALLAFFGLVQRMTWNGQLFWIGRYPSGGSPFASFVSRNSAGAYLNMCLAAALALAIWALRKGGERRAEGGERRAEGQSSQALKSPRAGLRRPRTMGLASELSAKIASSFATLSATKITAVALPALLFGGILCTASRGATLSALAAAVLVAPALVYFGRWRGRVLLILAVGLLGIGLVGWVGMQDLVQDRLGTLTDREELSAEGRLLHWRDSIRAAPDFWQTGSGLGTYRDVYLLYERQRFSSWFYHAENQYLEALIEGGAVGVLLMLLAIAHVAFANFRVLANRNATPAAFACGVAGLFALSTQVVHAFFDFSLYLPANMLLLAAICGATTATKVRDTRCEVRRKKDFRLSALCSPLSALSIANRKSQMSKIANVVASFLLFVFLIVGWREVQQRVPIREAQHDADFTVHPQGATQADLEEAMENLKLLLRPCDAESHYVMARLHTHFYRFKALEQLRQISPNTISLDELWEQTSPEAIHRQVHQGTALPHADALAFQSTASLRRQHLVPALRHLLVARQACPILSKIHRRIAPLSVLVDGPSADAVHLERACQTRPSSAYTWNKAARLDLQAGRPETAYQRFRKCLEISPEYLTEVLEFARPRVPFSELVARVLPPSPDFLLDAAEGEFSGPDRAEDRRLLVQRALDLLRDSDAPEAERQRAVGRALVLLQRYPEALRAYLYAVRERPNVAAWRYELSLLLLRQGHVEGALEQARTCLRLDPQNVNYQRHLRQVKQRRFVSGQP